MSRLQAFARAFSLAALAWLVVPAAAQPVTVVEYYDPTLDHYFITALQSEIDALDANRFPGWSRTGLTFQAFADPASGGPGTSPVCRFYIPPPSDSHFFSASPAECAAVLAKIPVDPNYASFMYETAAAFYIALPDTTTGACPAGTLPVYRLWNRRADSNHRYTADLATRALMLAKGYAAEGYGPEGVAMCTPGMAKTDTTARVTAFSPLIAGCDGVPPSGVLFTGAEVEPMIARDPLDANHFIGVWQQDRWSDGGAPANLTGVSFDGGRTWSYARAPFSRCAGGTAANGGNYPRASDPWVTIAPDGSAYQIAIVFGGGLFAPGSFGAVLVSRSADGGRTWGLPTTLRSDGSSAFNDKESITADPGDARYVYATWDRGVGGETGASMTWFARSTDGGASWEPARQIYDPGGNNSTLNNQIAVLPDGTLVLFFSEFDTVGNSTSVVLRVMRSPDKGANWSAPITIAQSLARGASVPENGTPIRDGSNLGSIAAGRDGRLVATWQDARFSNGARDGIAFAQSSDGGLTWSAPVAINAVPAVQAILPSVTVRDDGLIGVTYYDFRNHVLGAPSLATDYWLATSGDGSNWSEQHVAGSFDFTAAPFAEGLFIGDYQALSFSGSTFLSFYAMTNGFVANNRTDVFSSRVTTSLAVAAGRPMEARRAPVPAITPELERVLTHSARVTLQRRAVPRFAAPPSSP